jgi:cyclopropane-fatty-acyl-phospholipid synthase
MASAKETITGLLSLANITVNGTHPYDIQVHNEHLYERVLKKQQLGLGEAYMDGWWDAERIDQFIARLLSVDVRKRIRRINADIARAVVSSWILNRQTQIRAKYNASHHYNIGNDLYKLMLGKRMIYSCAYWQDARTLDAAQEAKLDLICRKLYLEPGMTLLDIGCGWGGFAEYAARKYGVIVTGITPAAEQVVLARERTKDLPVTILQEDYREVTGTFNRIVSIGMVEHVGPKNLKTFFACCRNMLKDRGIMLHHQIGRNQSITFTDPWIDKYIFPGGVIPTLTQLSKAAEKQLVIEDVHNFGPYYDKTLMAWYDNFVKNYSKLRDNYDERFYRMWTYYLQSCAGAFRARHLQLNQVVMRKIEPSDVYKAIR